MGLFTSKEYKAVNKMHKEVLLENMDIYQTSRG